MTPRFNFVGIPFFRSVRVTAQLDWQAMKVLDLRGKWQGNYGSPCGSPPVLERCSGSMMGMFRGLEGDENALAETLQLGGLKVPPLRSWNVQLRLQKLEDHPAQPLEFVPILALNDSSVTVRRTIIAGIWVAFFQRMPAMIRAIIAAGPGLHSSKECQQ